MESIAGAWVLDLSRSVFSTGDRSANNGVELLLTAKSEGVYFWYEALCIQVREMEPNVRRAPLGNEVRPTEHRTPSSVPKLRCAHLLHCFSK